MKRLFALLLSMMMLMPWCAVQAESVDDMIHKAEDYASEGEYEKALSIIELILMVQPENQTVLKYAVDLNYAQQNYLAALEFMEKLIQLSPFDAENWHLNCILHIANGQADEALNDLKYAEALELNAQARLMLYSEIGRLLHAQERYAEAVEMMEKVPVASMTEEEKEAYAQALKYSGQFDALKELGLVQTGSRDAELDEIANSGSIELVKLDKPDALVAAGAQIESIAPNGRNMIVTIDGVINVFDGEKVHPLYASDSKGVEDENGNLELLLSGKVRSHAYLGAEGVCWSPDGKYAVLLNNKYFVENMQMFFDPILIDADTGECILTATYGNKILAAGAAVTNVSFSADGLYLYYTLCGGEYEYRWSLMRYSMATGATELCYNGEEMVYRPSLRGVADGSWIAFHDETQNSQPASIVRFTQGEAWTAELLQLGIDRAYWSPSYLDYSANSDYVVLQGKSESWLTTMKVFTMEDVDKEKDEIWLLRGNEPELQVMTNDEYLKYLYSLIQTSDQAEGSFDPAVWTVSSVRMSPDGYYALVSCGRSGEGRLVLIDLENKKTIPVSLQEGMNVHRYGSALAAQYAPGMYWCGNGTLLMLTDNGIEQYRLE